MPKCSTSVDRKSRKIHRCDGCCAEINVGDNYRYTSGVWEEPDSFKHCLNCAKVIDNFKLMDITLDYCDGPSLSAGGVREFFYGFVYSGWSGLVAAEEIAKLFNVPLEWAESIFSDEK
jgi:hypothetical protein